MSTSLSRMVFVTQAVEFLDRFGRAGMDIEVLRALLRSGREPFFKKMVEALLDEGPNPFILSVDEQIKRLEDMSIFLGWNIEDYVFDRLRKTAPEWPEGKLTVRSFRIRFGEGTTGVLGTCAAHMKAIKQAFNDVDLWNDADGYGNDLRLLNGNETHRPCVEWILADLDTHRDRKSIKAVRNERSLADEMLVIAWMFSEQIKAAWISPKQIQLIDGVVRGFSAAGYEVNIGVDSEPWQRLLDWGATNERMQVGLSWHDVSNSNYSVPTLLEMS